MLSFLETLTLDDHEDLVELFRTSNTGMIRSLCIDFTIIIVLFFFITPLFRLGPWGVGIFFFILLLAGLNGWRAIVRWMGSVCIVTTMRVIVIERMGFWKKQVREVAYKEIVHSQYSKQGLINTARDIGSVQCVLKSTTSAFMVHHIVHPQRLLEAIAAHTTFVTQPPTVNPAMPPISKKEERTSFSRQTIPLPAEANVKKKEPSRIDDYWEHMQS